MEVGATLLPDHYEGRDGVVIGIAGTIADSYAFVLEQPPGTRIATADAEATYSVATLTQKPAFADLGDVDGDGQRDYLYGHTSVLFAARGPLRYSSYQWGSDDWSDEVPELLFKWDALTQQVNDALGDLNGDGVSEISAMQEVIEVHDGVEEAVRYNVVAFSPFEPGLLDLSCALPLGYRGEPATGTQHIGTHSLDLDHDGINDLVVLHQGSYHILVWWGRDLVEAHAALQP